MIHQLETLQKKIMYRFGIIVQNPYPGLNHGLRLYNGILHMPGGS